MNIRQNGRDLTDVQLSKLIDCFSVFKAEDDIFIGADNIFVRTKAFEELIIRHLHRTNTILLGRKGDGKTALIRRLDVDIKHVCIESIENKNLKSCELFHEIDIEETFFTEIINKFGSICEYIQSKHPRISSDHIAKKLWIKYLSLIAIIVVSSETDNFQLNTEQVKYLKNLKDNTESELGTTIRLNTYDSSQSIAIFFQKILDSLNISDDKIAREFTNNADPLLILRDLGEEFQKGLKIIQQTGINLTLIIDKFDDFIDRMISNDVEKTRVLRRNFLHGIIGALNDMERQKDFKWLRIIAGLPEDLVIDLNLREIGSHKALLFVEIKWTADDLRSILNHRVSSVILGSTWDNLFHAVPNKNKSLGIKEPCSDYIIRHTTRRPREVMLHALHILKYIRTLKKTAKRGVSGEEINEIISKSNEEIVQEHILPEWKGVFPNLTTFMDRIPREEPLTIFWFWDVSSWAKSDILQNLLSSSFSHKDKDSLTLICVSILFRVGVIGFRVKRKTEKKGFIKQGLDDYAKYIYAHSIDGAPINDVIRVLTSPTLHSDIDTSLAKAVISLLKDGHQDQYEVMLCFSPVFFESVGAKHDRKFIVDKIA